MTKDFNERLHGYANFINGLIEEGAMREAGEWAEACYDAWRIHVIGVNQ